MPARMEVGVKLGTCWKGGEMKRRMPAAWRKEDIIKYE